MDTEPYQVPPVLDYAGGKTSRPYRNTAATVGLIFGAVGLPLVLLFAFMFEMRALIFWPLFAIFALCWSVSGFRDSTKFDHAGRGRAKLGMLLGLVGVAASLFVAVSGFLSAGNGHGRTPREQCRASLRQLGQGMLLYANDHGGRYPSKIEELLAEDINPEVFVCPDSNDTKAGGTTIKEMAAELGKPGHSSYVYTGAGLTPTSPAGVVLAYERLDHHAEAGMNVLFGDGHVEWVDGKQAKRIRSELSMGFNPPRTPGAATAPAKK